MDVLWDINLKEMLGDLTVATFLMLLPASIVVVGLMVMLPLLDLAFKKKHLTRHHHELSSDDAAWRAGRPWLMLRSNLFRQLVTDLPRRGQLAVVASSGQLPGHWTSLIKRTKSATQKNPNLIVLDKGARSDSASPSSNAA
jgi:hypothetical protein